MSNAELLEKGLGWPKPGCKIDQRWLTFRGYLSQGYSEGKLLVTE
jgi:hypothetical protein